MEKVYLSQGVYCAKCGRSVEGTYAGFSKLTGALHVKCMTPAEQDMFDVPEKDRK